MGLDVGAAVEGVIAFGEGEWKGDFRSVNFSLGIFSGSVFWSPGDGGWVGVSGGVSFGSPGVAYEETVYTPICHNCCN